MIRQVQMMVFMVNSSLSFHISPSLYYHRDLFTDKRAFVVQNEFDATEITSILITNVQSPVTAAEFTLSEI